MRMLLVSPLAALARQQKERLGSSVRVISPEYLVSPSALRELDEFRPNFLVVDECHCLWDWGDRFRPAFQEIPKLLERYKFSRTLWLTATLPPEAREELKKLFPEPPVEIGEFALPEELHFEVIRNPLPSRIDTIFSYIEKATEPGIIFVQTRETAERLARLFSASGIHAIAYHAGLAREERLLLEDAIAHQIPDVVVATSAFGMGMNYPHLRWAILWQSPPSLLALAQAVGRVGRSGESARAILLWDEEDFQLLEWITRNSEKLRDDAAKAAGFVRSTECRRRTLEAYFNGVSSTRSCMRCDSCNFYTSKIESEKIT